MKYAIAFAAACLSALVVTAGPGMAADAGSKATPAATASYETGYEVTQGRRRGRVVVVQPRRRNVGRNVAIGVGALVVGGIIASEAARANSRRSGGGNCRSWAYRCDQGAGWACRNLDRYC